MNLLPLPVQTPIIIQSPGNPEPFHVHYDRTASLCWSVQFPHYIGSYMLQPYAKFLDVIEVTPAGPIFRSGSLERIFLTIADHIVRTEY